MAKAPVASDFDRFLPPCTDLEAPMGAVIGQGLALADGLVRPIRCALDQPAQQGRRMLSPEAAWITADIVAGASLSRFQAARSIANQRMTLPFETGASYGFRDAWVLAASRDVTVGIWVERPDGTPLSNNFGRQNTFASIKLEQKTAKRHPQ